LKTVEIVVEGKPCKSFLRFKDEEMVSLIVSYTNKALRDKLKALGGRWNPEEKLWRVRFGSIRGNSELEERILKD
jgi:hypothetical protein